MKTHAENLTSLLMHINSRVVSVMSRNFTNIEADLSIEKAFKILNKKKYNYLVVYSEGEFLGIICIKEINAFRNSFIFQNLNETDIKLRFRRHSVKEITRSNLVLVDSNSTLLEICEIYKSILFDAAFVVKDDRMIGFFQSKIFEEVGNKKCSQLSLTTY